MPVLPLSADTVVLRVRKIFGLSKQYSVHEAILGEKLDKRNFCRKIPQKGIVKPTSELRETGRKLVQLFRFSQS